MSLLQELSSIIKKSTRNIAADKLTPAARFQQDLDFDPQDLTEMLVLVEDAFKISLELSEVKELPTIAAAVEFLDKKLVK